MPRPRDPVADLLTALRAGQNPSIDEIVRYFPEQEQVQLRDELHTARRLFWASLSQVSDAAVSRAAERVKKARESLSAAATLAAVVRDLPRTFGHNVDALLDHLVSTAGLALRTSSAGAFAQPVVQYRGRSTDTAPKVVPKAILAARLQRVPQAAARLLEAAMVEEPPIHLEEISSVAGVAVTKVDLEDCDGCTFQFEEGPVICLNTSVQSLLRQRFTWAHELGHAVLHREQPQWRDTFDILERAWDMSENAEEAEANLFASELLLPRTMLKKDDLLDKEFDFGLLDEVADRYQVSYTAATVRFVNTTDTKVAVFLVQAQQILWGLRSGQYYVRPRRGGIHHESALALEKPSEEYYSDAPAKAWVGENSWGQVEEMGLPLGNGYWLIAVTPVED
jgi:Zn-dependent peptidase ImmA (M78 family)